MRADALGNHCPPTAAASLAAVQSARATGHRADLCGSVPPRAVASRARRTADGAGIPCMHCSSACQARRCVRNSRWRSESRTTPSRAAGDCVADAGVHGVGSGDLLPSVSAGASSISSIRCASIGIGRSTARNVHLAVRESNPGCSREFIREAVIPERCRISPG